MNTAQSEIKDEPCPCFQSVYVQYIVCDCQNFVIGTSVEYLPGAVAGCSPGDDPLCPFLFLKYHYLVFNDEQETERTVIGLFNV